MLRSISADDPEFEQQLRALARRASDLPDAIEQAARHVLREVRTRGDAAVRELTRRFENRDLDALELPRATWRAQAATVAAAPAREPGARRPAHPDAFTSASGTTCLAPSSTKRTASGWARGSRRSSGSASTCPGGTALYPSTVLMTAIVARVAGVQEVVMATPGPSPEALAAAEIAGVDRVFVIGGAQAIAALAYGTESVPRVDKIVGPGNAYVAAAKRLVCGEVGIDMVAGPTEVAIVADEAADPAWVAADLLAQAEHDELAVPILIAVGRQVADRVGRGARPAARPAAPARDRRAGAARPRAWPSWWPIATRRCRRSTRSPPSTPAWPWPTPAGWPTGWSPGAVFVGHHASEAVGDYFAGPSHVLPTGGSARYSSPAGGGRLRQAHLDHRILGPGPGAARSTTSCAWPRWRACRATAGRSWPAGGAASRRRSRHEPSTTHERLGS